MTVVASWLNKEKEDDPSIWTISDSKISNTETGQTLTLEGAKLFELNIKVKDISKVPPHRKVYFNHSIGYAFAGSALTGLNCYATLSTIFGNLGGNDNAIPDLKSIVNVCTGVIDYYRMSIGNAIESLIYGYCPKSKKLERYHIFLQNTSDGAKLIFEQIGNDDLFLLGNHKEEILESILAKMKNTSKSDKGYWRIPLTIVKDIISKNIYPDIGGATQLNITIPFGSFPYQSVAEKKSGEIRFRNIDIFNDIGSMVGECYIAIDGMDFNHSA